MEGILRACTKGGVMRITVSRIVSAGVFACFAALGYVTGTSAQQTFKESVQLLKPPEMLKGEDIGFRPTQAGSKIGTLMIRIDGQWVAAQLKQEIVSDGPRMLPAK
jgi:hypothetical protein